MKKLFSFVAGAVVIQIYGEGLERFLNLCHFNKIFMRRIKRTDMGITCEVSIRDFRRLKTYVRKAGVRIKILKRKGLPFFLYRNRHRKASYIAAVGSFAFLYIMSLFLWDIQFEGNSHYTEEVLQNFIAEQGYHHGMLLDDIACSEIERRIRNQYPDINWVSALIDGTRLVVKIKENTGILYVDDAKKEPADLISTKDGVIYKMVTREGTPMAAVGDTVAKGDVLVRGAVEIKDDGGTVIQTHYIRADADVILLRTMEYEDAFLLRYLERQYTDENTGFLAEAFGIRIALPIASIKEQQEIIDEQKQVCLFDNFYLPFYYGKRTVRKYVELERIYSEEEAKKLAETRFYQYQQELSNLGLEILENHVRIEMDGVYCKMSGTITVLEQVGAYTAIQETDETEGEMTTE